MANDRTPAPVFGHPDIPAKLDPPSLALPFPAPAGGATTRYQPPSRPAVTTGTREPLMDVGRFLGERLPKTGCQEAACHRPDAGTCNAPLHGRKQGQSCGRRVCAFHIGCNGAVICAAHARLAAKQAATAAGRSSA